MHTGACSVARVERLRHAAEITPHATDIDAAIEIAVAVCATLKCISRAAASAAPNTPIVLVVSSRVVMRRIDEAAQPGHNLDAKHIRRERFAAIGST